MKKIMIVVLALILLVGVVSASPSLKTYTEVENIMVNEVNFTITTNWQEDFSHENSTFRMFKDGNQTLTISVEDGKSLNDVKEVKSNKTIVAENTNIGSVEGYYVDYNKSCVFSYEDAGKLVTINAPDLTVLFDVIGRD